MRGFIDKVVDIIKIKDGKIVALCLILIAIIVFLFAYLFTEHSAGVFSFFPILFGQRPTNVLGIIHGLITLLIMIMVVGFLTAGIFTTKEKLITNKKFISFLILVVVILIALFIPANSTRFGPFGEFSIPDGAFGLTSVAILFSLALYIININFDKKNSMWTVCLLLLIGYSFLFTLPITMYWTPTSVFNLTQREPWIIISLILIAISVLGMVIYQILGYPKSLFFDIPYLLISFVGTIMFIVFAARLTRHSPFNFTFVLIFILFSLGDLILFVDLWRRRFGYYPDLKI